MGRLKMQLLFLTITLFLLSTITSVDADCPKCARFGYCDPTTSTCKCRPGFIGDGQDCGMKCGTKTCSSDATCSIDSVFGKLIRNCKCMEGFSGNGEICTPIPDVTTTEPPTPAVRIPCPDKDHLCSLDAECRILSYIPLKLQCACNAGFSGNGTTCTDIDECISNPCKDNSKCNNTKGDYRCECMTGFTNDGPYKCKDIDECKTSPCKGISNRCENTEGSYICHCTDGYVSDGANGCKDPRTPCPDKDNLCSVDALCSPISFVPLKFQCACKNGFSGDGATCTDIDECISNPCKDNSKCNNTKGGYRCECMTGFTNDGPYKCKAIPEVTTTEPTTTDIDECVSNPCKDNSKCNNTKGGYRCECMTGFTNDGPYKCKDIDECQTSCKGNDSRCENTEGSYICHCTDGYVSDGADGCKDIDECSAVVSPCRGEKSTCDNTEGSFTCQCAVGYTGDGISNCTEVRTPCPNKDHLCSLDAECRILSYIPLKLQCACNAGFSGNGTTCTDIDDCTSNPCKHNSTCINTKGGYRCECMTGFTNDGPYKCKDVDECTLKTHNCAENAICFNTVGSFTCTCKLNFAGDGVTCI